ncbi:MAG: glycosyltransferase family 4 protein [Candidatus Aminicenantes bacterium]|nr:glycosyltransferase family 4 protein [Candidatus Aminicenantes bacterium]
MKKKKKVLHIITRLDQGGSAKNTLLTVLGMDKAIYDVVLIKGSSHESKMSWEEQKTVDSGLHQAALNGVRVVDLPVLIRRINPLFDIAALVFLYILMLKERPRIVHTHSSKAGLLGRFAAALAGIPIIIHTPHGHIFWGYFGPLTTHLFILLERLAALWTDRFVALTNKEKEDYVKLGIAGEEKISVIHSGVEIDQIRRCRSDDIQAVRGELGIPRDFVVVGTVGRIVPVKGPEYFLKAARELASLSTDVLFVFVGDGELRGELEKKALDWGIAERVFFLGWREDVFTVMSVFDIFVLPSLNEGMGRVLVEAMALGKPIVASDVGGIPDLVVHGENGFLVPPKDSKQLASCIRRLIEDKKCREEMGQKGKKNAQDFTIGKMVAGIEDMYTEFYAIKNRQTFIKSAQGFKFRK